MSQKKLTIQEKWATDVEILQKGAPVRTSIPQCETCIYYMKGNALHCRKYEKETKPMDVLFAHKECPCYSSSHPLTLHISSQEESRIYGGVFGFCIGDMMGVPVEFSTREDRNQDEVKELRAYGTYHQPFGSWSDDSSLMFCLMDAMTGENLLEQLKANMISFYQNGAFTPRGEVFDIGISTAQAISRMCAGENPVRCGGRTERDNGNGSLMRILPLAVLAGKLPDEQFTHLVSDVSSLTHAHSRSRLACIMYSVFAGNLLNGMDKKQAYDSMLDFVRRHCADEYRGEFVKYSRVLDQGVLRLPRSQIASSGYVVDTLEAVLWTFFHTSSYEEAVLSAINLGGDTDTIAALVGGLAGFYYGFENIRPGLVDNVLRKELISELTERFIEATSNKNE